MNSRQAYAFHVHLPSTYEEARAKLVDALKQEGFGVLTYVDMKATLKEKLGVEFRSYGIFGACNPPLAERALKQDLDAGLVLPCSIVIYQEGSGSVISIADPLAAVELLGNPQLRPMAEDARSRLKRVYEILSSSG